MESFKIFTLLKNFLAFDHIAEVELGIPDWLMEEVVILSSLLKQIFKILGSLAWEFYIVKDVKIRNHCSQNK